MTTPLINVILLGIIAVVALESVTYWHRATKGSWKHWPAGRSLMYLLVIIAAGFGYGVINQFLGQYPARALISFALYAGFVAALVIIRVTITVEMRRGKKRLQQKTSDPTGPVTVTVASKNEESPDV
jgi:DMSO/TMAO reductase YedYZ heme-binding membrane subunit